MILVLLLILIALALIYLNVAKHIHFWADKKIKCLTPPTLQGAIRGSFVELLTELYTFAPEEPYVGITTLAGPAISIRDPDLIGLILKKDYAHFQDRAAKVIDEKNDPLSPNLFFLDGKRWRVLRRKISPIFSSAQLRGMYPLVKNYVDKMVTMVSSYADNSEPLDMKDLITRCTVSITLSLSYGVDSEAIRGPDDVYVKLLDNQLKATPFIRFIQNLYNAFPNLRKVLPVIKERKEINQFFLEAVLAEAHKRLHSGLERPDILNHILKVQSFSPLADGPTDQDPVEVTDTLMAAQAWGIFVAGTGTLLNTTSFALVELAHNVAVQDRLRQEVVKAIERHGALTLDSFKDMPYLDKVASETLRMHPALRSLKRKVTKTYTLPDGRITLPVGTRVFVNIEDLHRDPRYYPEPEKFDPERFTLEEKQNRHNFVYIPFGDGPRFCLGARFAVMELKLMLAALVSKFEFRLKPGFPYPPVLTPDTLMASLQHGAPLLITTPVSKEVKS